MYLGDSCNITPQILASFLVPHESNSETLPTTYVSSKDGDKWKRAMEEEMDSIKRNNVWELQVLPKGRKTVGSKWVFRNEGAVERYKARIVAQGYCHQDYDETFCPVVRFESLRMLIAVSASSK